MATVTLGGVVAEKSQTRCQNQRYIYTHYAKRDKESESKWLAV